jgi:hypothetical protein
MGGAISTVCVSNTTNVKSSTFQRIATASVGINLRLINYRGRTILRMMHRDQRTHGEASAPVSCALKHILASPLFRPGQNFCISVPQATRKGRAPVWACPPMRHRLQNGYSARSCGVTGNKVRRLHARPHDRWPLRVILACAVGLTSGAHRGPRPEMKPGPRYFAVHDQISNPSHPCHRRALPASGIPF